MRWQYSLLRKHVLNPAFAADARSACGPPGVAGYWIFWNGSFHHPFDTEGIYIASLKRHLSQSKLESIKVGYSCNSSRFLCLTSQSSIPLMEYDGIIIFPSEKKRPSRFKFRRTSLKSTLPIKRIPATMLKTC